MKKYLQILIILSGVIFASGQVGRLSIQNGLVFNLLDGVAGVGAGIFFYRLVRSKKMPTPGIRYLLLFSGLSLFALIIHSFIYGLSAFFVAILYLVRLCSFWLLFYLVRSISTQKLFIRRTLLYAGIVIIVLGFIQYIFYPSLRNLFYLGWDEHLFRMFSTFLDPNFAGAFFALFIPFICGFLIQEKRNILRISYVLLMMISLVALYLTYSRTGLIMLIVGIIAFFTVYGRRRYAAVGLVLILLGFILFANKHIEGLNPLRMASTVARLETVRNGLKVFSQNSLIGVGFNAYRYEQIHQGFRPSEVAEVSHADAGVDNSYVLLLATSGVIGSILYGLFVYYAVRQSLRGMDRSGRAVVVSMTTSFLVGGLFINLLFYPPLLFFILVVLGTTQNK